MRIPMLDPMTMDLERCLVEYPERQIDSLPRSISVAMFVHQIVHQMLNAKLDRCKFNGKFRSH